MDKCRIVIHEKNKLGNICTTCIYILIMASDHSRGYLMCCVAGMCCGTKSKFFALAAM